MVSNKSLLNALKKTINQEDQTQLQLKLQGSELKAFFPQVAEELEEIEKKIAEQRAQKKQRLQDQKPTQ